MNKLEGSFPWNFWLHSYWYSPGCSWSFCCKGSLLTHVQHVIQHGSFSSELFAGHFPPSTVTLGYPTLDVRLHFLPLNLMTFLSGPSSSLPRCPCPLTYWSLPTFGIIPKITESALHPILQALTEALNNAGSNVDPWWPLITDLQID